MLTKPALTGRIQNLENGLGGDTSQVRFYDSTAVSSTATPAL